MCNSIWRGAKVSAARINQSLWKWKCNLNDFELNRRLWWVGYKQISSLWMLMKWVGGTYRATQMTTLSKSVCRFENLSGPSTKRFSTILLLVRQFCSISSLSGKCKKVVRTKKNNNTDFNEFKESITFDWVRRSSCFGHRFLPLIKSALQFAMSSFEFNYKVVMEIRMEASKWRNGWEIIWQRNFNEH